MTVEEFLSRAWGWAVRRFPKLPVISLLDRLRRTRALGDRAHQWEPAISGKVMVRRTWVRALRALLRRLRYGGKPPDPARSAMILGQWLQMLDVAEKVLGRYRDGVMAGGDVPPVDMAAATADVLRTDGRDPIWYLRAAVAHGPNYAEAWCELGRLLLEQGDFRAAATALERVAVSASFSDPDRQPENVYNVIAAVGVKAWFWAGQAYEAQGETRKAMEAYLEALLLQPGCPIVSHALANLLYDRGMVAASLEFWGPAMTYLPIVVSLPRAGRDLTDLPQQIARHLDRLQGAARGNA